MKKILTTVSISLSILINPSCKTTKASCDAYGDLRMEKQNELEFDIHKINQEKENKFVSVTSIKQK